MWESLHNVDGDSCFCDTQFHLSHALGKEAAAPEQSQLDQVRAHKGAGAPLRGGCPPHGAHRSLCFPPCPGLHDGPFPAAAAGPGPLGAQRPGAGTAAAAGGVPAAAAAAAPPGPPAGIRVSSLCSSAPSSPHPHPCCLSVGPSAAGRPPDAGAEAAAQTELGLHPPVADPPPGPPSCRDPQQILGTMWCEMWGWGVSPCTLLGPVPVFPVALTWG